MPEPRPLPWPARAAVLGLLALMLILIPAIASAQTALPADQSHGPSGLYDMVEEAIVRLPLAAVLGAALALSAEAARHADRGRRPSSRRRSSWRSSAPSSCSSSAASLARAFGIVGAANLIRYRSKIDDPKDAGVMLCTLAVGLASGVGLYALAIFSTVFLVRRSRSSSRSSRRP